MIDEPQKTHLNRARELTKRALDECNKTLGHFDKTETAKFVPQELKRDILYTNPARVSLEEEFNCFASWAKDTGLHQYEANSPKHDFCHFPSFTKSSITGWLEAMEHTLHIMNSILKSKENSWIEGPHRPRRPDPNLIGLLGLHINEFRYIVVNLETSVDAEDKSDPRRYNASPSVKTLFRSCLAGYVTVTNVFNGANERLQEKLLPGCIEGVRDDFIKWAREVGVLLEGESPLETKLLATEKTWSRIHFTDHFITIESTLDAMSELLLEKPISPDDLRAAGLNKESMLNASRTERAEKLKERIAVLGECNKSLARDTKNLSEGSIGAQIAGARVKDNIAADT
ncbi:uncharacterized protein J4E78_001274 [Alternaria triticimaculans]|uniref:uncharacterized protein n=1 Tax=Alternaria triticimaculans TaxID=297637 RepID=UPI0020C37790|nr:uncharacterized protein J4E78_001274 [Alternaria triticimaculans]KAI4672772.1 hypothetical protein J4E78_001274 [Alternaria triticimaculans]